MTRYHGTVATRNVFVKRYALSKEIREKSPFGVNGLTLSVPNFRRYFLSALFFN